MLLQQPGRGLHTAFNHPEVIRVQVARQQLGHGAGRGRCQLRGFDGDAIAGAEGGHQRRQAELQRVIPRAEHQYRAQRFRQYTAASRPQGQRRGHAAHTCPPPQVTSRVSRGAGHVIDLRQPGLRPALAEVVFEGPCESFAVLGEQAFERRQLSQSPVERTRPARGVHGTQLVGEGSGTGVRACGVHGVSL